jgi:hypothetical protein
MRDAITAAIAARLGDVADAAFRLRAAVEAGAPAAPFPLIRLGLDADAMALALEGHAERLQAVAEKRPQKKEELSG